MEKRRQKRFRKRLQVRFGEGALSAIGFSEDLSAVGMFIKSNTVFAPGTVLKISLTLPGDQPVELKGKVVWARRIPPRLIQYIKKAGMGIRLDDPPPVYMKFLADLDW